MTAVIVGIGQLAAGDDGVGLRVAERLAGRGFATRACADASALLALLEADRSVVIVDAVVGAGPPGTVHRLAADALATAPPPVSSHGLGVADALELARTLYGRRVDGKVAIVAVSIAHPTRPGFDLSPEVAGAIEPAAALAGELAAALA